MRLLLLGGTSEGRALAAALHPNVEVISSLAGRVPNPALPVGTVRVGGFGGAEQMRRWLVDEHIDAVIDATHPFAASITARAARVCAEVGLPHLVLARPPWEHGDATRVGSNDEAAEVVSRCGYARVFLTTGRSGIAAFTDSHAWFLIRTVTEPEQSALPRHHLVVLSRGPYDYDGELALMNAHRIDVLVTKNSGGAMTKAKLDAAATRGIAVVMVDRPALPAGVTVVGSVEAAAKWVHWHAESSGAGR